MSYYKNISTPKLTGLFLVTLKPSLFHWLLIFVCSFVWFVCCFLSLLFFYFFIFWLFACMCLLDDLVLRCCDLVQLCACNLFVVFLPYPFLAWVCVFFFLWGLLILFFCEGMHAGAGFQCPYSFMLNNHYKGFSLFF